MTNKQEEVELRCKECGSLCKVVNTCHCGESGCDGSPKLVPITEPKSEGYHINHATCHECPCKINFDKMKQEVKNYSKQADLNRTHNADQIVRLQQDLEQALGTSKQELIPITAKDALEVIESNIGTMQDEAILVTSQERRRIAQVLASKFGTKPTKVTRDMLIYDLNFDESIIDKINVRDWDDESQVSCVNLGYNYAILALISGENKCYECEDMRNEIIALNDELKQKEDEINHAYEQGCEHGSKCY